MIKAVSRVILPYNRSFFFLFSARNTVAARRARVTGNSDFIISGNFEIF